MQDQDGYMWFGTDAGVSRFDGVAFMHIGPADGLTDNEVIGIYQDRNKRIWFLTLNGRLCYWWKGRLHHALTDAYLGHYQAASGWSTFCEDHKGYLWFGGIRGEILRIDPRNEDQRFWPPNAQGRSVAMTRSGAIVSIHHQQLDRFETTAMKLAFDFPHGWLTSFIQPPMVKGDAPLGLSSAGVFELSDTMAVLVPGTDQVVDPRLHRTVVRDPQGNLWLTRKDEGVDLFTPDTVGRGGRVQRQFGSIKVNTVYVTPAGDRWYCTASNGALLVDRQVGHATIYSRTDRNVGSAFISIAPSGSDIWLGTDLGHVLRLHGGRLEEMFRPDEGRLPGRILRIVPDPAGNLWFGTDWGLFNWNRAEPGILGLIPAVKREPSGPVEVAAPAKSVLVASDGVVWSPGVALLHHDPSVEPNIRELVLDSQTAGVRIYGIAEGEKGKIWFADGSELLVLRDTVLEGRSISPAFSGARITDLVHLGGDSLAIATAGRGVLLWSDDSVFAVIGVAQGAPTEMIRRLRLTGDTLWCATSLGLSAFVLGPSGPTETWTWSINQGLSTNDVYDLCVVGETVYMATAEGLCCAPTRPIRIDRDPPSLILDQVAINDSAVYPVAGRISMMTDDRIKLDVHALEFTHAELVEYAYAIDDTDHWSTCSRGQLILDGLAEGEHRMQMRARLPMGEWAKPFVLLLDVRPPWWASRSARVVGVLCGLSMFLLLFHAWSKRRFNKKLDGMRAAAALNEERRRIAADVHDDLGADLSRLVQHAQRMEQGTATLTDRQFTKGLSETLEKIDEIIWSLDPARDTVQGMVQFVEQMARECAEANGMAFRTHVRIAETVEPMTAKDRREIMLLAREALRNVAQHAQATALTLDWLQGPHELVMRIMDNGKGIEPLDDKSDRHGLKNMHERAHRLGGKLVIERQETQGTRVELTMPMKWNHPIG